MSNWKRCKVCRKKIKAPREFCSVEHYKAWQKLPKKFPLITIPLGEPLSNIIKLYITATSKASNSKTYAAERLKMNRVTMYAVLRGQRYGKKYKIERRYKNGSTSFLPLNKR